MNAFTRTAARVFGLVLFCMAVGTTVLWFFGPRGQAAQHAHWASWPFLQMWIRWDAGWYEAIARQGYTFATDVQSSAAYFPLYPLLIRGLMGFGCDLFLAGMVITWGSGLTAALLFVRWASEFVVPSQAERAVWILLLWPFAYYLYGAMYSDALYLALVLGAFLQLERRRVGWATLLGALATATRPVAPALVTALFLRQWELRRKEGRAGHVRDGIPLLSAAGLLAYMGFLYWKFGDALAFVHAQQGWRQKPGVHAWLKLELFEEGRVWSDWVLPLVHACLAFLMLGMAGQVRRRIGWGYAWYVVVTLAIPLLSSRDFIGLGRYSLAAFPSFLALALVLDERPGWRRGWQTVSLIGLVLAVSRFALGHYVS